MMALMMAAVVLSAGPTYAAESGGPTPGFSGQGEGKWEMLCHAGMGQEEQIVILGPDKNAYANAHLTRASCTYKAGLAGDLVISVATPSACPLKGAAEGSCTVTVPRGRAGSFELRVRR